MSEDEKLYLECSDACRMAPKGSPCHCRCGGKYHGMDSTEVYDRQTGDKADEKKRAKYLGGMTAKEIDTYLKMSEEEQTEQWERYRREKAHYDYSKQFEITKKDRELYEENPGDYWFLSEASTKKEYLEHQASQGKYKLRKEIDKEDR